jgi:hypothetical protein
LGVRNGGSQVLCRLHRLQRIVGALDDGGGDADRVRARVSRIVRLQPTDQRDGLLADQSGRIIGTLYRAFYLLTQLRRVLRCPGLLRT